jgi:hypothetical protein
MLLTERLRRISYMSLKYYSDCEAPFLLEPATAFRASAKLFGTQLDNRTPPERFEVNEVYYCIVHPLAGYTASFAKDAQILSNIAVGALTSLAVGGGMIYAAATLPLVAPALAGAVVLGGIATAAYPAVRGFLKLPPPAEKHGLCALLLRGMFDTALLAPMAAGYVGARVGTALELLGAPLGALVGGAVVAGRKIQDEIIAPLWNCGAISNARNFADAVTERVLSCPRPNFSFDAYAAGERLRQRFASLSKKTAAPAASQSAAPQPPAAPPAPPKGP